MCDQTEVQTREKKKKTKEKPENRKYQSTSIIII